MSRADARATWLRIAQLRTEAERETRTAARRELLLTAETLTRRVERLTKR